MTINRLIVYTVGKTIEPIEYSLKLFANRAIEAGRLEEPASDTTIEPSVLFVASNDTLDNFQKAKSVARSLGAAVLNNFQPILVDPFDFRDIQSRVKDALQESVAHLEDFDEVIFDLTGGTKAMSAALSAVAFEVLKPGARHEVFISYIPGREVPDSQTTECGEPILTHMNLDEFLVPEILNLLDNARTYEAFALAEYLTPHSSFHRWIKSVISIAYALDRFAYKELGELLTGLQPMNNEAYQEVMKSISSLDNDLGEKYLDLLHSFQERIGSLKELVESLRRLRKLEACGRGPSEHADEHIAELSSNTEAARLVPVFFLNQAVVRSLRKDSSLVIVLCYRAIEAALQVEFLLSKKKNLWDFGLMQEEFGDIVKGNSVTLTELEQLVMTDQIRRQALDDAVKKLRSMRNHGILAHGYQDYETQGMEDLIRTTAREIADLCFDNNLQTLATKMEQISPLRRDCPLWIEAIKRLFAS